MITDKNRIYDGFTSLEGGVDAGRKAHLLDPNQCESAENMTFRGGHITTRPGVRKLAERFTNPNHSYFRSGKDAGMDSNGHDVVVPNQTGGPQAGGFRGIYKTGIFQGAVGYSPHSGEDSLMVLIGGRLFRIIPRVTESVVTEVPLDFRNNSHIPLAYMIQADKFMIAQDGESKPIIYDGNTVRRSKNDIPDPDATEIPLGTIMAYGMGRIVVIVIGRDVAFGDLYGSHDLPDPADSLPLFTERNFLAEGFDAAIPFQQGVATGMIFFPQLDTSTGNGQLLVFAERGAASFFLSLPRDQWKTSQFQILALLTTGMRGHRSISAVNEDLWFRSDDGWRSYRQARSEPSGWAHIPLSTNVKQFLNADTSEWLKFASSIYFDNRIIATCSPAINVSANAPRGRPYHDGMVVVDFDILSSFGTRFKPAWDGHWTLPAPVKVLQLVTGEFNGVTRAFIFGLDSNNENQLYELTTDDKDDWDMQHIPWEFVSRGMNFQQQSTPFNENELYDGDIWLRGVVE